MVSTLSILLTAALPDFLRDAEEVFRAFFPYVKLEEDGVPCGISANLTDGLFCYAISGVLGTKEGTQQFDGSYLQQKKYAKRFFKNLLYDMICTKIGVSLPYGSLTGVRPTKLFYELEKEGCAKLIFADEFRVRDDKIQLVNDAIESQRGIYLATGNHIDLYVNIPFCPTRCAYCSFLSAEYPKVKSLIPQFIQAIKSELAVFSAYLKQSGRPLRAVYVGGGTPTALTEDELAEVLQQIPAPQQEFSVEAGRADTVTAGHLAAMAAVGVTRVSVNPQSFDDKVLKNIGRAHTAAQTVAAFQLAKSYGFDINMDFIAGLEGETTEGFLTGIQKAIALKPDNITVHTLSLKRGSTLATDGVEKGEFGTVSQMTDGARAALTQAGYRPYYMYRQKNTADNLENVGYCLAGKASYYNVDIMEETTDIYAVGAGGMSKRVLGEQNRIERYQTPKGLHDYLARIDEILQKKPAFFQADLVSKIQ